MKLVCVKCNSQVEPKQHQTDATHHIEWHCKCGILIGSMKPLAEVKKMTFAEQIEWIDTKQAQWKDVLLRRGKIKEVPYE